MSQRPGRKNAWKHDRNRRLRLWGGLFLLTAIVQFFLLTEILSTPENIKTTETAAKTVAQATMAGLSPNEAQAAMIPPAVPLPAPVAEPRVETTESVVKSGQTAAALLQEHLTPAEIHELDLESRDVFPLTRLRAGKTYRIATIDEAFDRFEYEIDGDEVLVVKKTDQGFTLELRPIKYDVKTVVVSGVVESNLFDAVKAAGEKPALAVQIADVFAWDVDFCRDIRKGDTFQAVVEKRYRDGEFAGYGKMPVAEFVNQGEAFRGFLYPDENGRVSYYDEDGKALRKVFLKAPLSFTRISSGFTYSRLHPILNYRRPHTGIDYAAPKGTPVWSVGDGKVIKAGYDKAAGRYVKIRHNSVYTTQYNHLNGFARGIKAGASVRQGQVVGYVGSTGLATGPHLDFRMTKNGSAINPTRMKSPSVAPLAKDRMPDFAKATAPLRAMLLSPERLADLNAPGHSAGAR